MSLLVHDDASLQLYANCVGAFRFFSALFVPSNATSPSTKGRARQFPLRLTYVTTFDGCQGVTFSQDCFRPSHFNATCS